MPEKLHPAVKARLERTQWPTTIRAFAEAEGIALKTAANVLNGYIDLGYVVRSAKGQYTLDPEVCEATGLGIKL